MSIVGVIRGHIHRIGGNRHRRGKEHLLPARCRLVAEGRRRQPRAVARPQVADVSARIGRGFVEPDSGDRPSHIRPELYPQFHRTVRTAVYHAGHRVFGQMVTNGTESIVMLSDLVKVCAGLPASITLAAKLTDPVALGVPVMASLPGLSVRPGGRYPQLRCESISPAYQLVGSGPAACAVNPYPSKIPGSSRDNDLTFHRILIK